MKQKNIFAWVGLYLFLLPVVCIANKGMIIDHGHDPDEKKPPVYETQGQGNVFEHDVRCEKHVEDEKSAVPNFEHGESIGHDDYDKSDKKKEDHSDYDDKHAGHDKHENETAVFLTKKAKEFAGLEIAVAHKKNIIRTIELPGEIGFNEDRMVHIVPRYPGIVNKVFKQLGEKVTEGELIVVVESNESLTNYGITSPISGKIVEKRVVPGVFVGEDVTLFVIADLSTVWVNCDVFAKDADLVKKDMDIIITDVCTNRQIHTTVSYVAPVYNTTTRSMMARAVISNMEENWRPGTFITGTLSVPTEKPVLAIPQEALQVLHGEIVVFVPNENITGFEPVVVQKGEENNEYVEILSGLALNESYVSKGAFELKAKIITSALGDHAGHGH